jgi:pimeloyl-ACP methyl ester carboxylesterase
MRPVALAIGARTPEHGTCPEWFTRAIGASRERHFVDVAGCSIHYLRWGDAKRPGLVFIPAGGGHAYWFAHVAPLLADQFHVVALDPAGCGDSGRRHVYTQKSMIADIMAVCADSGMFAAAVPPTLVGHSAGAQFAVRAAMAHPDALLGVISIDGLRYAKLAKDPAIKILEGPRASPRPSRIYPTLEAAVARFHLTPAPLIPIANSHVVDYIAAHSFRPVEGGWTSKHDPAQGCIIELALELRDVLKDLKCPAAAIYAEHTHLADETVADKMTALNDGVVPVFVIPGTSHYPHIDSPFAFVAAIKAIVLTWISTGRYSPMFHSKKL